MKKIAAWIQGISMAILIALGTVSESTHAANVTATGCIAETAFSPRGGGKELILDVIDGAKQTIRMATYSFTEPQIAKALLSAKKRGVNVAVVVDKDHNGRKPDRPSAAGFLSENGVSVFMTDYYKIQHNKFIVADGVVVQTGSFNYSRSAEMDNAENVLVLRQCPQMGEAYIKDWNKLRAVARAF